MAWPSGPLAQEVGCYTVWHEDGQGKAAAKLADGPVSINWCGARCMSSIWYKQATERKREAEDLAEHSTK